MQILLEGDTFLFDGDPMDSEIDNSVIAEYLFNADQAFEALLEFCHRVERGDARSIQTYKEFRTILIAAGRYEPFKSPETE